ncbi:photosynthetic complex assembly protein PuhC [Methylobacterium sp. sgz302541]|uniref:photosynthetic complex assembly protein PuhC n=1 Tax=unclassified Methylobacterium TaxID=2615210 RepID=UPI003D33CC37
MTTQAKDGPIPSAALLGAGALLAFSVVAVGAARIGGVGLTRMPETAPVARLALTVADRPDGAILLEDSATGRPIDTVEPGSGNFVRATLRGFAQARLRAGYTPEKPFLLTRYADGSLTLSDETTGRVVNLGAFGLENARGFAKILDEGSTAR